MLMLLVMLVVHQGGVGENENKFRLNNRQLL